jgi:hypothetical protein
MQTNGNNYAVYVSINTRMSTDHEYFDKEIRLEVDYLGLGLSSGEPGNEL